MEIENNKDIPIEQSVDDEGHMLISSRGIESTFHEEGTLTFNKNNNILTWNAGDITHLNFLSKDFMIMYDIESNILTLTSDDKNILYELDQLKELIEEHGLTVEEMEKEIKEKEQTEQKGDEQNGNEEAD